MFLNTCENYSFLSSILLIKRVIEVVCLLVPVILVLAAGIALAKIVFNPNIQMTKKDVKKIANKFIAAAAVFFVPLLVSLLMTLLGETSVLETECWTNANNEAIAVYKSNKEVEDQVQRELDDSKHAEAEKVRKDVEAAREKAREENEKKNEDEIKKYQGTGGILIGDVVYYNQGDYGGSPYGSYGTIASHGCGPTSAAIVASTFLKPEVHDPIEATNWVCAHGGCTSSGSYFGTLAEYLKSLGIQGSELYSWNDANIEKLNEALLTGDSLAIILVHEPGNSCPFTNGGHFLVITGMQNGEYTIADPESRDRTKNTWPASAFSSCSGPTFYIFNRP